MRRVLVGILAALLVGALAANLSINLWITNWINGSQDDVSIEYRWAWMLWPGRVHGRGVQIIGHDSAFEWLLEVDEVSTHVDFLALLRKTFAASDAETKGVRFFIRSTRPLTDLCALKDSGLPSIPTLNEWSADDLTCRAQKDTARRRGAASNPDDIWHVNLTSMSADLQEPWFERWRFRGQARVEGGTNFWPTSELTFHPTTVEVLTGSISVSSKPVAESLTLAFDGQMKLVSLRAIEPDDFARAITLSATIAASLQGSALLSDALSAHVTLGTTTASATVVIRDEHHARGAVKVRAKDARVQAGPLVLRADLALDARTSHGDPARGVFAVDGAQLKVTHGRVALGDEPREAVGWWARADVTKSRIRPGKSPFLELHMVLEAKDLRPLWATVAAAASMPTWVRRALSGEGAHGMITLAVGEGSVRAEKVELVGDGVDAEALFALEGDQARGALLLRHGILSVGVAIENGRRDIDLVAPSVKFLEKVEAWRRPLPMDLLKSPPHE